MVLDHGATSLKLKDLVRRQVSEGHSIKEGLCVLSQGLLWAEVRPGSDDFEVLIFRLDSAGFGWIRLASAGFG